MTVPRSLHGAVVLCSLLLIVATMVLAVDDLPKTPICPFRRCLGVECYGCGMTRAFCAIGHGRWGVAWQFNKLSFLFYPLIILGGLRSFSVLLSLRRE